eukprot:TRINITY_DN6244_c0_g1_i1.p1 TRINITY_DN6244_c0_g1~~TRINITY_DN6244_c0_g1_i1.p1  ORF type:complete len:711 (+),score=165.59 TRINITY_DN6244_c0_g1_i1:183-2135(+)
MDNLQADEDFQDQNLIKQLQQSDSLHHFFRVLSVCHAALPEHIQTQKDGTQKDTINYQSSSPDEVALLNGAALCGFVMKERDSDSITVDELGKKARYEVLNVLEFDSDRKRMSVIVKDNKGRIELLCKGADNVVWERLRKNDQDEIMKSTLLHIEEYARAGLRTLGIASRQLDQHFYDDWNRKYEKVQTSSSSTKAKELAALAEEIEVDLELLGATGVEDRLQDGVPETIDMLLRANIRIWVLTGDKEETAVNIGNSCRLIANKTLLKIRSETEEEMQHEITQHLKQVQDGSASQFALIISGKPLGILLFGEISTKFLELADKVSSVVICRATPLQKAQAVTVLMTKTKNNILSVGDGANDVPMIQSAHVGVGIHGKEGSQAVLAADYSIGQFRFLQKLLLVHGRWSYRRLSLLIFYMFYKQLLSTTLQFYYCFYNAFSGTTVYDDNMSTAYNILFTSIPIIAVAVLDQDLPARQILRFPGLYKMSQNSYFFNQKVFWSWIAFAFYNTAIIFWFTLSTYKSDVTLSDGLVDGFWTWSVGIYTICVWVASLQLCLRVKTFNWVIVLTIALSVVIWHIFAVLLSTGGQLLGTVTRTFATPVYWLELILVIVTCLLPDFFLSSFLRNFYPRPDQIVEEIGLTEKKFVFRNSVE